MTGADLRDGNESWPVSSSRTAFSGGVISVRVDEVAMPGGTSARRDLIVHPGSVGVLVVEDTHPGRERVLVLSQYRHPVQRRLWELPAGLLDPGESAFAAARRELLEETHLVAADWRVLIDAYTTPGCSDEAVRIFLARGARRADGDPEERVHEEADMELRWVPLDDLIAGVLAGALHNPLLVMGALALRAVLAGDAGGDLDALRVTDTAWPDRRA